MNNYRFFISTAFLIFSSISFAQEREPAFGISFSGYVKNDFILDTRQTITAREGHFLLYPANALLDKEGNDINSRASFNYFAIQSRITGAITGPQAFGARTSGILEGEFFGTSNTDINGFRLRHAYIKLNWTSTELLIGQYWHMKFITACYPGTVSFNTGTPFQFFSRNPQIRITQHFGKLSLSGMTATQRDFSCPGGSEALRNSLLPDLNGQITYTSDQFLLGIVAGYKRIVPRIQTDSLYKTATGIGGLTGQAFMKVTHEALTFKLEATYLQNGYDGLSIGGFAVRSITDPERDYRSYTNINTLNVWTELHSNGSRMQVGIFAGYSQNLGASEVLEDVSTIGTYTRGADIAYVYRISPRVVVNSGNVRFAFELEHTAAAYGKTVDSMGLPGDLSTHSNNRFLVAAYYFF